MNMTTPSQFLMKSRKKFVVFSLLQETI